VAARFCNVDWKVAVSWSKTSGNLAPVETTPAEMLLLIGAELWPQRMLVVKLASNTASCWAIRASWSAGS
jgi:hypothetical protein